MPAQVLGRRCGSGQWEGAFRAQPIQIDGHMAGGESRAHPGRKVRHGPTGHGGHRSTVQLRCHLTLLHDVEPDLRGRARSAVVRWNPGDAASAYAALSPTERSHLDLLIDRSTAALGRDTSDRLRWYLRAGS